MYKIYFKQAIHILNQNRFISAIAILGTAFAIMMIMAIIISDEVKKISVAPEINRHRTLYIPFEKRENTTEHWYQSGNITVSIFQQTINNMKVPEKVSVITNANMENKPLVNVVGHTDIYEAVVRATDASYWDIFSFSFKEGKPFTPEAAQSGMKEAVIVESLARTLFKGESAVGHVIQITEVPYRVVGVVKDVSAIFKNAYSEIWVPYTSHGDYRSIGALVIILAKDKKDYPAIDREVRNAELHYNAAHPPMELFLQGPEEHSLHILNIQARNAEELEMLATILHRRKVLILVILLLIPAINLSGLSLSRIKKRTEEIGIRKAFGAKRYSILLQILYENLITSIIGGIVGLVFSYLIIFRMRDWLLDIPSGGIIPVNTLISFPVVLAIVVICILINLLSAGIPAYRASRMTIIQSLTQNVKTV